MATLREIITRRLGYGLLVWALLFGFVGHSYTGVQHQYFHSAERITASAQPVSQFELTGCVVCDALHLAPETPQVVVAPKFAPLVEVLRTVPPIFTSDNFILLPLGARAPPAAIV